MLLVLFNVGAAMRHAHSSDLQEAVARLITRCIFAFLFPTIGVLIYANVNKSKHSAPHLFATTCFFALILSIMSTAGEAGKSSPSSDDAYIKQRIIELAKEATGQATNSGNQNEYDDIFRAFFADIKKFNDDYNAEAAKNDNSAIETMYGAESYKGDENITRVLQQLNAMLALERKYASMEPVIQKTKDRLFASPLSESKKEAFWAGFEGSIQKNLQPRREVFAKEQAWLQDSIGLYEFMQANKKSFHVKNNKIVFISNELLNEYKNRFDKVDAERREFLSARDKFDKVQREGLGQLGLKPSDFGVAAEK